MAPRVPVEVLRGDICDSDGRVSVCLLKAPPRFPVLAVDENGKLADRVWWRYGLCARYRRAYDILHVAAITFPSGVAAYTGTLGYFFAPDDQYIGFLGNALWLVPGRVLIITRGKKTYDDSMLRCLAGEFF